MAKFKVGDRVRVNGNWSLYMGQTGKVASVSPNGLCQVKIDNSQNYITSDSNNFNLESISVNTSQASATHGHRFKMMERVRINSPSSQWHKFECLVVRIRPLNSGPFPYTVKFDDGTEIDSGEGCLEAMKQYQIKPISGPVVITRALYTSEHYATINKSPVKELTQPKTCSCLSWDLFQHGCRCGAFDGGMVEK